MPLRESRAASTSRSPRSASGGFLDSILAAVPTRATLGWFWQLEKLPDAPHTRYLYHLMASHEFQEGLKNYRDLRLMQRTSRAGSDSLEAFDTMIAARETGRSAPRAAQARSAAGTDLRSADAAPAGTDRPR